jgi:hypothetical protein
MKRLIVQDRSQNTKNPMTTVMPRWGMEVANTILNHLVVVHSSQLRSTNYVTYMHLIFFIND